MRSIALLASGVVLYAVPGYDGLAALLTVLALVGLIVGGVFSL